jgi:hypothetical protein
MTGKKNPQKAGFTYSEGIWASRAKRVQGIFDGEGVSVPKVRDRLAGENNAAIAGRFALPAQSALAHPCARAQCSGTVNNKKARFRGLF